MAKIIAFETATEACSAALLVDDTVTERFEIAPRRHTDLVLPMVAELLADAGLRAGDLDAVAFGAGPGSFTGVRVATSIAQGIALAHDLPVIPVSCLAILAVGGARAHACATVIPVMDARKKEVYWAVYRVDPGTWVTECIEADAIGSPGEVKFPDDTHFAVVGTGTNVCQETLSNRTADQSALVCAPAYPRAADALPRAVEALRTNTAVAAEFAEPVYLRRPV